MIMLATGPVLLRDVVAPKPEPVAPPAAEPSGEEGPDDGPDGPDAGGAPDANGGPGETPPKAKAATNGKRGQAPLAAAAGGGRPRRTAQTVPKRQRNFWQAARAPALPRARPSS